MGKKISHIINIRIVRNFVPDRMNFSPKIDMVIFELLKSIF